MKEGTQQLYWGILHCHVQGHLCHKKEPFSPEELIELETQIDQLYQFARNDRKFDFLVYADHHNMGDMVHLGNVAGSPWRLVTDKVRQHSEPGQFIALPGYEYQDGMEYNVYLRHAEQLPLAETWRELMAQVQPGDPGVIFAAHNRPSPTDWRFPKHANFRLIEILNEGSVFEGWANDGLRMGHAAGFIGGSDDHGCRPGRNACTGVWADELSADAIWDALRARRTVAATGIRPSITFRVNGAAMGSALEPATRFHVEVSHRFHMRPLLAMLIADGRLLSQREAPSCDFEFAEEVEGGRLAGCRTLYLKILYPDGNMAFASPVFLSGEDANSFSVAPPLVERPPERRSASRSRKRESATPCVEEFGERMGWHCYVNANPLLPDAHRPMQQIRDMIMHVGPDALLVRRNGEIVAPTMDGVLVYNAKRESRLLRNFSDIPDLGLLTALVEIDDAVIAGGYRKETPECLALVGNRPEALQKTLPIRPFIYRDRFVTPRYLASDGRFLACLAERECTILVSSGKVVAFCQEEYPAFPCALDMSGLDCIVVMSCDGAVVCYDAAASQSAVVRWRTVLPEARSGVTIAGDEVWCYNRSFYGCYAREPIEITVLGKADGSMKGSMRPDLINIRGVTIRPHGENSFVAMHNPQLNGSAVFRRELNVSGVLRVYAGNGSNNLKSGLP